MRGWGAVLGWWMVAAVMLGGCSSPDSPSRSTGTAANSTRQATASDGSGTATAAAQTPPLSADGLRRVAKLRVFFAHRSVGAHIVDEGVPAVFRDFGVDPPIINEGLPQPGGSLGNTWLEQPDDPRLKLDDFATWVRDKGAGNASDVALMKLGYVDVNENTDVSALYAKYRAVMAGLEHDFPNVTFLHTTISVTRWSAEANVAYERFNQLLRADYASTGRLFDLARVFSTRPDGTRTSKFTTAGDVYYEMNEGYTTDGGHPNAAGAEAAAAELLRVVAATPKAQLSSAG
ncbi:MAG: hypothetical protein ACOYBY_11515 [Dermatophilaceae bacterium]